LVEAMTAVAITGIIAALAVPNLLPVIHRTELGGATDNVLGFVSRARVQAFADRRCVQMIVQPKVAGQRQTVLLRELNTYDCDGLTAHGQSIASAPRVVSGGPLWTEIDRLDLESALVEVSFINHPPTLTNAEGNDLGGDELRLRGNGRIWSPDDVTTDDNVTIQLRHLRSGETKQFRVASNGVVIDRPGGT
jgi:type II secretory pathway pseudopilin PulG